MKAKLWDVTVSWGGEPYTVGQVEGATEEIASRNAHILYGYTDEGMKNGILILTPVPPTAWDMLMEPEDE